MSAYGGWINPSTFRWSVSLTLMFPFLLTANVGFLLVWLVFYSRKWLWSFAALVLCVGQIRTYCPVNIPQPVPKGSIKVVSYNLFNFFGLYTDTLNRAQTLDYLAKSDADIICAQEAQYNTKAGKQVAEATKHWAYRDTVNMESEFNPLMICSNFPIIDHHVIRSPSKSHACAVYRLKIEHDTVVVVNCHFVSNGISSDDKKAYHDILVASEEGNSKDDLLRLCRKVNEAGMKRAEQADSLAAYLETLGDVPVIVCGDFNDSPLSYVHHRLTRNLSDAYTASGNGPGITYYRSAMLFRLDNILCSHHWRSFGANVDSRQKMSDHYPIETWLIRR